jgi:hypothetical protein
VIRFKGDIMKEIILAFMLCMLTPAFSTSAFGHDTVENLTIGTYKAKVRILKMNRTYLPDEKKRIIADLVIELVNCQDHRDNTEFSKKAKIFKSYIKGMQKNSDYILLHISENLQFVRNS